MSELLNRIDLRFEFVSEKLARHVITESGCWEYQGSKRADGYGYLTLSIKELSPRKRKYRMHRLVYAYYNGIDPAEMLVCHKCDNPSCINPYHLFLGTSLDNTQDMHSKGRGADFSGRSNGTPEIVLSVVGGIQEGRVSS